jgi:BirA family biotin operon repressor/biotin-[acetyl-CoA-carboxylase] ligase
VSGADHRSGWTDLERPPLAVQPLRRALVREGSPWVEVRVVATTGSTNADLATAVLDGGAPPGSVLVAEEQTEGRGRLDRTWTSPPRSGLTVSVLLSPTPALARWGWLPLLTGLAVVDGLRTGAGLTARLKWPNDVLAADPRKLGGVQAERVEAAGTAYAVVGLGLNVSTRAEELPVSNATSLALAGAETIDRQPVLVAVLRALAVRLAAWESGLDPVEDYRAACATLGRPVRVERVGAEALLGTAVDVDATGRLVVVSDPDGQRVAVSAGDVMHLR